MSQGSNNTATYICDEPANYPEHHTPFSFALAQNYPAPAITAPLP
jgi:hypothetical protein